MGAFSDERIRFFLLLANALPEYTVSGSYIGSSTRYVVVLFFTACLTLPLCILRYVSCLVLFGLCDVRRLVVRALALVLVIFS